MTKPGRCRADVNESRSRCPAPDASGGDLVAEIGRVFLGAPYQPALLDATGAEKLAVSMSAFDCVTFVETVLALADYVLSGRRHRSGFRGHLKKIRYRQGKINGYASRLHYFTDWLADNEKKRILKNVSRKLGGKPLCRKINFMTAYPDLYPALKNKAALTEIRRVENRLSRKKFYLIDKAGFNSARAKIINGDIIAFASGKEGLDVAHTGFAVRRGRYLHLLHASSKEGAVVISQKSLGAFLKSNRQFTGIFVARVSLF